jgi:DNA-binding response OmpR family regulator
MAVEDDGMDSSAENGDTDPEQPTVLIVDDEEVILDSYELYLESADFEVVTAANGGEALVELEPSVDVVLLDRRMPGMTGDEVLEHIRDWHSRCRVVMVTAVDPDVDIVDMEFDDYLTKPVSKDELLDTVEQLLLFDRYEELLMEYHSLTRTYATLRSNINQEQLAATDPLEELDERRTDLREEIESTIEQFTDQKISEIFRSAHGPS